MKKLMIMLAAVAATVAANATTFSWGISGTDGLDATKFASGTAYLFYGAGSTLTLPSTTGWDSKESFAQTDITSSDATLYGTGAVTDGKFYTTESGNVANIGGKTGSIKFYMAVISDDGKNVAIVTSTATARIMASTTAGGPAWAATKFTTYSAAAPVPEPTSGLLLVMGLAGLALRRRKA